MPVMAERDTAHAGPPRAWVGWGLAAAGVLLLGGYLLFCHGCHGDVDDELFAPGVERQWAAELRYADCVARINADKNKKR